MVWQVSLRIALRSRTECSRTYTWLGVSRHQQGIVAKRDHRVRTSGHVFSVEKSPQRLALFCLILVGCSKPPRASLVERLAPLLHAEGGCAVHGHGGGGVTDRVPTTAGARIGNGQRFDGDDDRILVSASDSFNFSTNAVTMEYWADVEPEGSPNRRRSRSDLRQGPWSHRGCGRFERQAGRSCAEIRKIPNTGLCRRPWMVPVCRSPTDSGLIESPP